MDNITKLWIRACKSLDPETRVNSVYRRFYCEDDGKERDVAITIILSEVVHKYVPVNIGDLVSMLSPNHYIYGDQDYFKQSRMVITTMVRRINPKSIPCYTPPARFRRGP